MQHILRVTARHPKASGPKVDEAIYGHTVDKIARSVPGLSSKQIYELKTKGKVELVEDGCDVVIEIIPYEPETFKPAAKPEPKPGWLKSKKWFRRFW